MTKTAEASEPVPAEPADAVATSESGVPAETVVQAPEPEAGSADGDSSETEVDGGIEVAAVDQEAGAVEEQSSSQSSAAAAPDLYAEERGERRLALVVGNCGYDFDRLANPVNDARDIAAVLRELGFEVVEKIDVGRGELLRAVIEFGRDLRDGGVGLFYYAGHAVQVYGRNYLVPLGAVIESEDFVPVETVELDQVLWRMGGADNRLNIVILDACRDNPFASSFRGISRGLAATPAPAGIFVAYATSPGGVASDGAGRNSPYTAALLHTLDLPGLQLEDVFKRVLALVRRATKGMQTPWISASIVGDFYFHPPEPTVADYDGRDRRAWNVIRTSDEPIDFESYLEAFPDSPLAPLARSRLRQLMAADADGPNN